MFAVIGFLTLCGLPATIPSCTGAPKPSVLGAASPGGTAHCPPLARPRPRPPTRLVVRPNGLLAR